MAFGVINGEIWQRSLASLEAELDPQIFTAYIKPLRFSSFDESTSECEVLAPSSLVRNQVDRSFRGKLERVLTQTSGNQSVNLRFMVDAVGEIDTSGQNAIKPSISNMMPRTNLRAHSGVAASIIKSVSNSAHTGFNDSGLNSNAVTSVGNAALAENPAISTPLTSKTSISSPQLIKKPIIGRPVVIRSINSSAASNSNSSSAGSPNAVSSNSGQGGSGLNSRYIFSTFVVGNSNQFCHAAAQRVAEQPGLSYNPLFIYGGVGLGKTHLLHAIGNSVLARKPNAKVVYMSSETFTNELIQALRNARMDEFKQRMRSAEVLLIDDIQFMSGKERTQEEFFHTFNTLYNAKHQIVITSDKIPHDIAGLEERLKTRFSWGLIADIQAPDYETRVAILRGRASSEGFDIPQDVAEYVAENISSNVRELEGAFTKLHAVSSLQGIPVTLELCRTALRPLLHTKSSNISIDEIKKVVAEFFNIKVSEMVSKRRTKNLSFPRHIAMYLCRKHTTASYPEIGFQFGGRDHSSVIHAANVVAAKVAADNSVGAIISKLEQRLFASH